MMRALAVAGGLCGFTLSGLALMAAPAAAAPAAAGPVWSVDRAASKLGFAGAMNGQSFQGVFERWNAEIVFNPNNLAASHVTAVIDTASARTGDQTRDEALPTADWLSVKAFPRATFTSRGFAAAGPGRYVAQGDLTIRNVTRTVTLPFTLAIAGDTAKMSASLPLDRAVFGVGQAQWKTGEAVALRVQVNITIAAKRAH
jgi:polyisoprenoid-binding protein YceI